MQRILLLVIIVLTYGCSVAPVPTKKINGVSFVASRISVDSSHVSPILSINANSASIMPFGFIRDKGDPKIIYNTDRQWFGETKAGARQYISELHKANISVMLKPHIWLRHGEFTGHFVLDSETNWQIFEASYKDFILEFAEMAEETKVDVFCVGTELELFIKNRPSFWHKLIQDIRTVYSGKLTYAANWDEFWRTPFWSELDYIGIDAYFPLSEEKTPSFQNCFEAWNSHKKELKKLSQELDRPILFTEYGYRSVDYAAKEPWRFDRSMTEVNLDAQNNALRALYDSVWGESWFAGGYLWKWFVNHDKVGGMENNQFTPQNKPVEQIITSYYSSYK